MKEVWSDCLCSREQSDFSFFSRGVLVHLHFRPAFFYLCFVFFFFFGWSASVHSAAFRLYSKDWANDKKITQNQVFNGFGCHGQNLSPQLSWSGEPKETKSFALTIYDPDAPTGSGWWHWVVVNIPASIHALQEGASSLSQLPSQSLEIRNDYGTKQFGGVCPPVGQRHRYMVTLWALKVETLDMKPDSSAAMAGFMIMQNSLAKAELVPYFERKK